MSNKKVETKDNTQEKAKKSAKNFDGAETNGVVKEDMTTEEYISYLEEELGKSIASSTEQKNSLQRLMADFENYKKRNAKLAQESRTNALTDVLSQLLAVLDNLERARAMISDESALCGFELIEAEIKKVLEDNKVCEIEALDCDFDPNRMCAMLSEQNEAKKGKVLEVFQKGYMMGDRVLRYAQVKIAT